MPMNHFFNPLIFGSELVYSLIILILCLMVFFKTKEIYNLTKHKGIQFFRYAFLLFGLAYASRLILFIIMITNKMVCDFCRHGRTIMPVSNLVVAYLSTMAILYLAYSTMQKKANMEHFITISNIIALFVSVIAFISRSPIIVSFIQLILLLFVVIAIFRNHKGKKKHTRALYLLIFVFWLLNLFVLGPSWFLPFWVQILLQLASIGVFITIYYKVIKWAK